MLPPEMMGSLEHFSKKYGLSLSDSMRLLMNEGLKNFDFKTDGKRDLMLNEQLAIQAILESVTLLRHLIKDKEFCNDISQKVGEKIAQGWVYLD